MSVTYEYPRPAVTTDAVLFGRGDGSWSVLLIQRKNAPFRDYWALPGGFLDQDEDPAHGAARELEEETGLTGVDLQPLGFWGQPGRDPRGHTVSLVYCARLEGPRPLGEAADDAKDLCWHPIDALPPLAFDHREIIAAARELLTPRP